MVVQAYGPAGFRVSGHTHAGAIIVLPDRVITWQAGDYTALDALRGDIDVFLLGTGTTLVLPPKDVRLDLKSRGIHAEAMDTGAACRAYNALMADGRRVAAALCLPTA